MTVLPPHGDLDDVVELRERAVTGNEQSSPYLRLKVVQRDLQLDDGLRSRILRLAAHGITLKVKVPPLQIEGQELQTVQPRLVAAKLDDPDRHAQSSWDVCSRDGIA